MKIFQKNVFGLSQDRAPGTGGAWGGTSKRIQACKLNAVLAH